VITTGKKVVHSRFVQLRCLLFGNAANIIGGPYSYNLK